MTYEYEEVRSMLLDRYDPTEIVDILLDSGITDEDILDSMEELIMLNPDIFSCPEKVNPFEDDEPAVSWNRGDVETEGDWD
jgi:hypothetical protein